MRYYLSISFILTSFMAAGTLCAATQPHAGPARPKANLTWTNDALQRLSEVPQLISVVGQSSTDAFQRVDAPGPRSITKDPNWYATRAASLNARLEVEQVDLRKFTQALDDARELKNTAGGVNLAQDDVGITPEATIEILQSRVRETQKELDALEDLARENDIPPGVLRGQWRDVAGDNLEGRH